MCDISVNVSIAKYLAPYCTGFSDLFVALFCGQDQSSVICGHFLHSSDDRTYPFSTLFASKTGEFSL